MVEFSLSRRVALAGLAMAIAQSAAAAPRMTRKAQRAVVRALSAEFVARYVFPAVAADVALALRADLAAGVYDAPRTPPDLAAALTDRLRALTRDKHVSVRYSPTPIPVETDRPGPDDGAARIAEARAEGYGIVRVERLANNVGFLRLDEFAAADDAADAIAAAMRLLAYTDALIIDLRANRGGYPDGVAQIVSYLIDKPTHLYDMVERSGEVMDRAWTRDRVAGPHYGERRPVYVLTSGRTFSGGEDLAYTLKNLKRAVVVGERTGGAANPGRPFRIDPHFSAFIPFARPVNAVTGGNWEGEGVTPDIAVPADDAQAAALRLLKASVPQAST